MPSNERQHHDDAAGARGVGAPGVVPRIGVVVAFADVEFVRERVLEAGVQRLGGQVVATRAPPSLEPPQFAPGGVPDVVASVHVVRQLVFVEPLFVGVAVAKHPGAQAKHLVGREEAVVRETQKKRLESDPMAGIGADGKKLESAKPESVSAETENGSASQDPAAVKTEKPPAKTGKKSAAKSEPIPENAEAEKA